MHQDSLDKFNLHVIVDAPEKRGMLFLIRIMIMIMMIMIMMIAILLLYLL